MLQRCEIPRMKNNENISRRRQEHRHFISREFKNTQRQNQTHKFTVIRVGTITKIQATRGIHETTLILSSSMKIVMLFKAFNVNILSNFG